MRISVNEKVFISKQINDAFSSMFNSILIKKKACLASRQKDFSKQAFIKVSGASP